MGGLIANGYRAAASYGEIIYLRCLAVVNEGNVETRHKLRTNRKQGVMLMGLALFLSFALLCSLAVALSIVPMISSVLFEKQGENKKQGANKAADFFQSIRIRYRSFLVWSLKKRGVMLKNCVHSQKKLDKNIFF